jgi:hypothetical protein
MADEESMGAAHHGQNRLWSGDSREQDGQLIID